MRHASVALYVCAVGTHQLGVFQQRKDVLTRELGVHDDPDEFIQQSIQRYKAVECIRLTSQGNTIANS